MGIFDTISAWVEVFVNIVIDIFNRVISWFNDVIAWFRKKIKNLRHRKAVMMQYKKLKQMLSGSEEFKEILVGAPTIEVGLFDAEQKQTQVVEAVYNEETDKVEELRVVAGDGADDQLSDILEKHEIVNLA